MTQVLVNEFFDAVNNGDASQVTAVLQQAESSRQSGADDIDNAMGDKLKVSKVTPSKDFKDALTLDSNAGEV